MKNTEKIRKSFEKERLDKGAGQLSKIKVKNIIYPILFGLGVVFYMIYDDFDASAFSEITINLKSIFWFFIAVLFMFGRDIGYIIRLRIFSEGRISWYECFKVIMLWEFTSAITPSAVGGTSVAVLYVHKAGISIGESTAMVLLTSFFDELYFIIMFPLIYFWLGHDLLFNISTPHSSFADSFLTFVIIGYSLKLIYLLFVSYGLFIRPRGIKWLLIKIFSLPFLRKWKYDAVATGDDIIESSKNFRKKPLMFWIKSFMATFLSWSSRYLVVNALILSMFSVGDHLLLFGRQLIMWIMMLILPTPGGSGFSEFLFKEYLGEFLPIASVAIIMALIWRLITYYPYLIIGAIIFPRWLAHKFKKPKIVTRYKK